MWHFYRSRSYAIPVGTRAAGFQRILTNLAISGGMVDLPETIKIAVELGSV
jgi:hypothetical protein